LDKRSTRGESPDKGINTSPFIIQIPKINRRQRSPFIPPGIPRHPTPFNRSLAIKQKTRPPRPLEFPQNSLLREPVLLREQQRCPGVGLVGRAVDVAACVDGQGVGRGEVQRREVDCVAVDGFEGVDAPG